MDTQLRRTAIDFEGDEAYTEARLELVRQVTRARVQSARILPPTPGRRSWRVEIYETPEPLTAYQWIPVEPSAAELRARQERQDGEEPAADG